MARTKSDEAPGDGRSDRLRDRIRAEGGLYRWVNARLIRIAGPAQISPLDAPSTRVPQHTVCPACGQPWDAHEIDRSLGRSAAQCPAV